MLKKGMALFAAAAITLTTLIPVPTPAEASTTSTRSHIIVSMDRSGTLANMHGGYVWSNVPDLTSNWSSTNNGRFILKTEWVNINGNGSWIENGYFEGADMNSQYYDGFYMAYGIYNGSTLTYSEKKVVGPSKTVGSGHHHHIKYLGDSVTYWRSTIDNAYQWDVYGFAGDGSHDVGVEANNSASVFNHTSSNKSAVSNLQYYEDGSWKAWNTNAKTIYTDPFNIRVTENWDNTSRTAASWWRI
ncbi:hypothetical protein J2T17_006827 [Paenibacillus mucilaginosus]|uniref:hypothetical protein n=1 Tax=Paenibacillus mucilaginosus TaxID=61624 RepID=UPI003D22DEC5